MHAHSPTSPRPYKVVDCEQSLFLSDSEREARESGMEREARASGNGPSGSEAQTSERRGTAAFLFPTRARKLRPPSRKPIEI